MTTSKHYHPALTGAMRAWLQAGHKQVEFTRLTGLHSSVASRLASGDRPCSDEAFVQVFQGFNKTDPAQAMLFLMAWLKDHTPQEAQELITVSPRYSLHATPADNLEMALQWVQDNYRKDGVVAGALLAMWGLAHSDKPSGQTAL